MTWRRDLAKFAAIFCHPKPMDELEKRFKLIFEWRSKRISNPGCHRSKLACSTAPVWQRGFGTTEESGCVGVEWRGDVLAGPQIWTSPTYAQSRFHRRCCSDACVRDRREHGRFQHRECGAFANIPVSRSQSTRSDLRCPSESAG